MKTNPNDAVFARQHSEDKFNEQEHHASRGLTKREYFAAMAMSGFCGDSQTKTEIIANLAVKIADQLIDELNKQITTNQAD
jgi:hypothetical protein